MHNRAAAARLTAYNNVSHTFSSYDTAQIIWD